MNPSRFIPALGSPRRSTLIARMAWLFLIPVFFLFISSSAHAQGFPPAEAVRQMRTAQGFEVNLFASEPDIRQPVSMSFDDKGRLWVIQYLQYPSPAGLKPVKVDQYLRTVYDQLPEPPPKGPVGADRITICEDTNHDGRADQFKDFISGLNLATGLTLGHGGVFVLQAPYLLFYPDKNRDDLPDGDPEVLLTGFGIEDAHALANSLQWGPDGWLYGAQGSTVTANIRGIEFQQGIWRYHPLSKDFELFAEGGGNTWGLDFDENGNVIAGTNFGDQIALHQVQGAYYLKNFGKHGELHNPHAYGYFDHIPYTGFRGGHVTCGGIVYLGGAFPDSFRGSYIAANLLANTVYWHTLEPRSSTFAGRFGGELLNANDTWFRPVDCALAPDGSVFIADWSDQRATHVDPTDNWDRSNGRIYRISATGSAPPRKVDLNPLPSRELISLLSHRNNWFAREALRILAERRDPSIIPELRQMIRSRQNASALKALWALYVSGGFDERFATTVLDHPNEYVRAWIIRLLGDHATAAFVLHQLIEKAQEDPSPIVRSQLASTAKRLPGSLALPIIFELLLRRDDEADRHIPMLLWWALESKAISHQSEIINRFQSHALWKAPIVRTHILPRLGRRYAAESTPEGFQACVDLLVAAPVMGDVNLLLDGMEKALAASSFKDVPPTFRPVLENLWQPQTTNLSLIRFALRLNSPPAIPRAWDLLEDPSLTPAQRSELLDAIGQNGHPDSVGRLLRLVNSNTDKPIRLSALAALQRFADPAIATALTRAYAGLPRDLQARARSLLLSRDSWALPFLTAVDQGLIPPAEIPLDQLRLVALHKDPALKQLVKKHWGEIQGESEGIKRARVGGIVSILGQAKGDPAKGQLVFQTLCASCHTLFGSGTSIGPDLTGTDRKNRDFLITSIVDPNFVIRREFMQYEATLKDDRVLSGLLTESSPTSITILDRNNQPSRFSRAELKELRESTVSLMPEGLLDQLAPQQLRDLFSYLQASEPPSSPPAATSPH